MPEVGSRMPTLRAELCCCTARARCQDATSVVAPVQVRKSSTATGRKARRVKLH